MIELENYLRDLMSDKEYDCLTFIDGFEKAGAIVYLNKKGKWVASMFFFDSFEMYTDCNIPSEDPEGIPIENYPRILLENPDLRLRLIETGESYTIRKRDEHYHSLSLECLKHHLKNKKEIERALESMENELEQARIEHYERYYSDLHNILYSEGIISQPELPSLSETANNRHLYKQYRKLMHKLTKEYPHKCPECGEEILFETAWGHASQDFTLKQFITLWKGNNANLSNKFKGLNIKIPIYCCLCLPKENIFSKIRESLNTEKQT